MKKQIKQLCCLCLALLLLPVLPACRSRKSSDSPNRSDDLSAVTSDTNQSTKATTEMMLTTANKPAAANKTTVRPTAAKTTKTPPKKNTVVSVLRKNWDTLPADTKKLLNDCGLKKEDLVVDMSTLTYDKERSSTNVHPSYATYTRGNKSYTFNDPQGRLTGIDFNADTSKSSTITEAEAKRIGKTVADLVIGDAKNYSLTCNYIDTLQTYGIGYARYIDNYVTTDSMFVEVDIYGKLRRIGFRKLGLFDDVNVPKIDKSYIDAQCAKILKGRYLARYEGYTLHSSKLDVRDGRDELTYRDHPEIKYGQLVMVCSCIANLSGGIRARGEYVIIPLN